jgi:hypothetical protein
MLTSTAEDGFQIRSLTPSLSLSSEQLFHFLPGLFAQYQQRRC